MNEEYRKKLEKIKQELLIMKTLNIKPNYSELSRIYNIDRRTIKKYNNGYCRENIKIIRKSKLDNFKNEIKEKLELPGITIIGLYQYFSKDNNIGVAPIILFNKEKEYLKPLPNQKIMEPYLISTKQIKISNESLFYYKGKRYSVPNKYIEHTLSLQEENNKLYVYYNKELITIHEISEKNINYKEEHYIEGLSGILQNKTQEQILDFKNLRFIENKENIIFVGSPGVGKTHLATSIGIVAAKNRDSTYFINCNDLISNLKKANSENRFMNRLNHYAKYKVLIIDEMGFLLIDNEGANMLFQLINKRYENHSTIITTNKPFGKWYEIFGDVTLANAILDRLLRHSHIININGNSYRLKDKLKSEIAEET